MGEKKGEEAKKVGTRATSKLPGGIKTSPFWLAVATMTAHTIHTNYAHANEGRMAYTDNPTPLSPNTGRIPCR